MNTNRLLGNINRALGGGKRRKGQTRGRAPMFIGDYANKLRSQHPCGQNLSPPIEAWYVQETGPKGRPEKVKIEMIRGSSDYFSSRADYAETVGRHRTLGTTYLFPVKGYAKPKYAFIMDNYGGTHNWVAIPRGWKAERAAEYGITLEK